MSTITDGLDAYAAQLAAALGLPVTRNPGDIVPPCLYLGMPSLVGQTLGAVILEVPVHLVAEGAGDGIAKEWLLDRLADFGLATSATVDPSTIEASGIRMPTYLATSTLTIRSTTP